MVDSNFVVLPFEYHNKRALQDSIRSLRAFGIRTEVQRGIIEDTYRIWVPFSHFRVAQDILTELGLDEGASRFV